MKNHEQARDVGNIIKTTYFKPIVNILLSEENLKVFPLRSDTKQGCPFCPLLFSVVLEVLARAIWQEKKVYEPHAGKAVRESSFADATILPI